MRTALFTHHACLRHDTGPGHPESADRLRAVLGALEAEEFHFLDRRDAPEATREQLLACHPGHYVDRILASEPEEGWRGLDPDTVVSPGSVEAALRAAGAVCAAVDAVMAGEAQNAFCAVRPPGHHAEPDRAMGFCLFNGIAVGALHALRAHRLKRVAVVDFDVHHGNGTQAIFWDEPGAFYASTHQAGIYPGTGFARETGGEGMIVNVPLHASAAGPEFRNAYQSAILPKLEAFAPEIILVSAGFDAHMADPLAGLDLSESDFAWVTDKLVGLARSHAQGRLVSVLEGGYNLHALASSAAVHVRRLMEA